MYEKIISYIFAGVCISGVIFLLFLAIRSFMALFAKIDRIYVKVVAKREMRSLDGSYFVTFENKNSKRIELPVNGQEFGLLAEGDHGFLKMKKDLFWGFEREIS